MCVFYFLLFSFQFQANSHNWGVFSTDNYNIIMPYDLLLQESVRGELLLGSIGLLCYADNSVIIFPMVNLHQAMKRLVNIN